MIYKKWEKSIELKKLEALLRRLPLNHSKRPKVEKDYARKLAGYKGEESLNYYLSFLSEKKYFIFHNIRLKDKLHYFQMDTLLLSPYFLLIIESKNMAGTLFFDHANNQLIRTLNEVKEVFPDPVQQVRRQQTQLGSWFNINKSPPLPIETLVVITNPYSLIEMPTGNPFYQKQIIRSTILTERIEGLHMKFKNPLTKKELRKLTNLLLKHNTPYNPDILKRFQIDQNDLLLGLHCPHCFFLPMEKRKRKWVCTNCSTFSKEAHISSLEDYFLLVKSTITNKEMRDFLQISSSSVVNKLLISMNLQYAGTTRDRQYYLPFKE